jgi:shikimate 5-dehydrogenase
MTPASTASTWRFEWLAAMALERFGGYVATASPGATSPIRSKEEAFEVSGARSDEARRAQAVNTIFFGREILGTTTDGAGARTAIEALLDEPVALKRIGVLGYGATARAVLAALQENDAYALLWGRTTGIARD